MKDQSLKLCGSDCQGICGYEKNTDYAKCKLKQVLPPATVDMVKQFSL
jgi:hypothetical protein